MTKRLIFVAAYDVSVDEEYNRLISSPVQETEKEKVIENS